MKWIFKMKKGGETGKERWDWWKKVELWDPIDQQAMFWVGEKQEIWFWNWGLKPEPTMRKIRSGFHLQFSLSKMGNVKSQSVVLISPSFKYSNSFSLIDFPIKNIWIGRIFVTVGPGIFWVVLYRNPLKSDVRPYFPSELNPVTWKLRKIKVHFLN